MDQAIDLAYAGKELALFARARNWKRYWSVAFQPFLRGDVLEVGAGLGANTVLLRSKLQRRWVCLEPDARLVQSLGASLTALPPSSACEVRQGTLDSLDAHDRFDAILYIDVLEHIADDVGELRSAAARLHPQGRLLVLAPAHPWLFSEFDAAVGHHRRYTRKSLQAAGRAAGTLRAERLGYLDGCGLFASLANRLLLRQAAPGLRQILFWDRVLIPMSRIVDPLLRYRFGKSILAVWIREGANGRAD